MSDPQQPEGDPAAEHENVDDVVGSAHEGLAEAEAAGREAVSGDGSTRSEQGSESASESATPDTPVADAVAADAVGPDDPQNAPADGVGAASPASPWAEPDGADAGSAAEPAQAETGAVQDASAPPQAAPEAATDGGQEPAAEPVAAPQDETPVAASATVDGDATRPVADEAETTVVAPAEASEAAPGPTSASAPVSGVMSGPAPGQPIFVQAPEEPRPRGNRGAAGGIGVLAALSFAVLYLLAWLVIGYANGEVAPADTGEALLGELGTWGLWVPVIVFFIAFWLLGAIINRSRWGAWVIFGLLVGLAAYGGHLLGQLFEAPFWMITTAEGTALVQDQLFAPLAVAALVIGRELTIWFGAWVAARGRRMSELNVEARREYERTLEAGPQLSR